MDKKGVSQIVTTILIILLVLAAIVIVWQAVKGTVESGAETIESKTQCIGISLTIATADATVDTVTITRDAGGTDDAVSNVRILVNDVVVTPTSPPTNTTLVQLESKIWGGITLDSDDEVKVAPVLDATICDVTDTATAA